MDGLSRLPNIGKELERQLELVGIKTKEQLVELGSEEVWLRIQKIDSSACIHRLLALEGAIQGVKKSELPTEEKARLRAFYQKHKIR